jgi:hypothetical protein
LNLLVQLRKSQIKEATSSNPIASRKSRFAAQSSLQMKSQMENAHQTSPCPIRLRTLRKEKETSSQETYVPETCRGKSLLKQTTANRLNHGGGETFALTKATARTIRTV